MSINPNFTTVLNNGTISLWCYTNGRGYYTTGNNQEGKIDIANDAPLLYGTGQVTIYWSGAAPNEYIDGFSMSDLNWVHVTVTWKNAEIGTGSGYVTIYNNGTLQHSYTGLTLPANDPMGYVYIGHYDSSPSSPYNGRMDDVRIYNRALSSDEVSTLYLAGAQ